MRTLSHTLYTHLNEVLVTGIALAFVVEPNLAGNFQSLLAVLIIGAGGLHGAVDAVKIKYSKTPRRNFAFYLALTVLILVIYPLAPKEELAVLLAVSVAHFGNEDLKFLESRFGGLQKLRGSASLFRVSSGLLPILGIFTQRDGSVQHFLLGVVSSNQFETIDTVAQMLIVLDIFTLLTSLVSLLHRHGRSSWITVVMSLSLFAAFERTSPLIVFALYFFFIHSMRSLYLDRKVFAIAKPKDFELSLLAFAPLGVITVVSLFIYPHLLIGVALAFTVPHMALQRRTAQGSRLRALT